MILSFGNQLDCWKIGLLDVVNKTEEDLNATLYSVVEDYCPPKLPSAPSGAECFQIPDTIL